MPGLSSLVREDTRTGSDSSQQADKKTIQVYMMDLWSFIPYYVAHLCGRLREEAVNVILGSARYHLDRNYFDKVGLIPDHALLDFGGALKSGALRRIVKSFEYVINLLALIVRFSISRPDILHVQFMPFLERGLPFELWFMKLVQQLGIRVVYTVHNLTPQNSPDSHRDVYERAYRNADMLICHGEEARTQLIQDFHIPSVKIKVIPHGPLFAEKPDVSPREARFRLGLAPDEPLVASLGVISEYKGIPFLLDAWKSVVTSGTMGRLLVAGTGDPRLLAAISTKVVAENLESSVDLWLRFIPVEQLPLLYQAADILVYPYMNCTTSGALLTGLNYGKPIVATNLPFFREHLRNGESSILVEYGDIEGLAAALGKLIRHPESSRGFSEPVPTETSPPKSWSQIAETTRLCYESLLKS